MLGTMVAVVVVARDIIGCACIYTTSKIVAHVYIHNTRGKSSGAGDKGLEEREGEREDARKCIRV